MSYAMQNRLAQHYANTAVETAVSEATPHKLVEMLYIGAIKNLKLTKVFIEQRQYEKKSEFSGKGMSILLALKAGVDVQQGGEVAENLYALYDYCHRTVFRSVVRNDLAGIDEVIEHLEGLKDAWQQMPEELKRASKEQISRVK
ncbi:flagellar protein FliS [Thiosulfatimonas sediminis]|uniref:Flagellar secretion chaperone FliS n=1 Tax=Thiosulfatimonas sediminis TaxID=2675054 RepID=A0A6F8PTR5_9GAMM|nr:flagellar export chaperone FliS [Thiosulfatimonas sediminis]BBP45532.1 flagellar protein FliS [Thiosulfatimonas sediminis]